MESTKKVDVSGVELHLSDPITETPEYRVGLMSPAKEIRVVHLPAENDKRAIAGQFIC